MVEMPRFRITRAMLVRMAADAIMAVGSLMAALIVRFFIEILPDTPGQDIDFHRKFGEYLTVFGQNVLLLPLLCLVIFYLSGFYTYGRAYQGRYKAIIVAQAVTQAYMIYAVLTYFAWDAIGLLHIPRGALVLAWSANLGTSVASRTWTDIWERVIRPEREVVSRRKNGVVRSVLVIGGAGYIGSALLPKLLERGYRVRVLDMFLYGMEPIENIARHPNLELIKGDFRHVEKVVEAMRDIDAVVHLGAIVGDPACELDKDVTVGVNLSATQMIAQVAKASGISRFLFASTCSVYGACDELLDERSEVKPISLYGQTKLVAERGLQSMADGHFMPTILRFATIYGLSGRTRFDLVVNLLAAKAKTEGRITVNGGAQWRPFVHVDDAAQASFKVLVAPLSAVANQIYNVGADEQNYTILQIGEMIRDHVVGAELLQDGKSGDRRNYRVSFAKIRNTLGFRPRWTLAMGIQQVLEAVSNGEVRDYRDAKYSNVKFLGQSGAIEIIRADDDWSRNLLDPVPAPHFVS